MRYIIMVIISLLTSCGDNIYNTTQTIEGGGSRLFSGKCYTKINRDTVFIKELIDINKYRLSTVIKLFTINS